MSYRIATLIATYTIGAIALAGVTTLVSNSWLHTVVDEQLYSSHMKVYRTGELFLTPLIQTNLYALLVVSLLVLIFSVVVFRRLNKHFSRMDSAFNVMAAGDYQSYDPPSSRFEEINARTDLVRKSQDDYRRSHHCFIDYYQGDRFGGPVRVLSGRNQGVA